MGSLLLYIFWRRLWLNKCSAGRRVWAHYVSKGEHNHEILGVVRKILLSTSQLCQHPNHAVKDFQVNQVNTTGPKHIISVPSSNSWLLCCVSWLRIWNEAHKSLGVKYFPSFLTCNNQVQGPVVAEYIQRPKYLNFTDLQNKLQRREEGGQTASHRTQDKKSLFTLYFVETTFLLV